MTSISSGIPYTYTSPVQAASPVKEAAKGAVPVTPAAQTAAVNSAVTGVPTNNLSLPADILSLLQGESSSNSNSLAALFGNSGEESSPLSALLGSGSSNNDDPLSLLLGGGSSSSSGSSFTESILNTALSTQLTALAYKAAANGTNDKAITSALNDDPMQSLLDSYNGKQTGVNQVV